MSRPAYPDSTGVAARYTATGGLPTKRVLIGHRRRYARHDDGGEVSAAQSVTPESGRASVCCVNISPRRAA